MSPLVLSIIGSFVRTLLAAVGGYVVGHHWLTDTQVQDAQEHVLAYVIAHVEIYGPVAVAVLWSILQKYGARLKQIAAADLPAGASDVQITETAKTSAVKAMAFKSIGLLLAGALGAGVLSACASLPVKQQAVVSLQASETALEAAHDAERLLCSPTADQTAPIRHCDGAQAIAIGLTDARHQAIARVFAIAFDTQIKAATALKAWRAGDPAPSSVADYQRDLTDVLTLIQQLVPQAVGVATQAQDAVNKAAAVAAILGVK